MTEVVHANPAWRDRADFIVAADVSEDPSRREFEQMWARQLSASTFEICCIPFIAYDLALGDIVEARPDQYVIERVVESSGHHTFRTWLSEADNDEIRDSLIAEIRRLGALWEWASPRLVAIDVADVELAHAIASYLSQREQVGEVTYETGRTQSTEAPPSLS